jgi:hypothetical protein
MPVDHIPSYCLCAICRKHRTELQRYTALNFRERKAYRITRGSAPMIRGHQ